MGLSTKFAKWHFPPVALLVFMPPTTTASPEKKLLCKNVNEERKFQSMFAFLLFFLSFSTSSFFWSLTTTFHRNERNRERERGEGGEYRFREWKFSRLTKTIFSICVPILFFLLCFTPQNQPHTQRHLTVAWKKWQWFTFLAKIREFFFLCMPPRKKKQFSWKIWGF